MEVVWWHVSCFDGGRSGGMANIEEFDGEAGEVEEEGASERDGIYFTVECGGVVGSVGRHGMRRRC